MNRAPCVFARCHDSFVDFSELMPVRHSTSSFLTRSPALFCPFPPAFPRPLAFSPPPFPVHRRPLRPPVALFPFPSNHPPLRARRRLSPPVCLFLWPMNPSPRCSSSPKSQARGKKKSIDHQTESTATRPQHRTCQYTHHCRISSVTVPKGDSERRATCYTVLYTVQTEIPHYSHKLGKPPAKGHCAPSHCHAPPVLAGVTPPSHYGM